MVGTVCRNWHTSHRDFHHPLAQFPTPSLLLPSPGVAPESPWEDNRLVVFLSEGGGRSDSSPPWTEETPMVPDSYSLTNFFSAPVRLPPVICLFLSLLFLLCLHLSLRFLFLSPLFLRSPPQFLLLSPFLCCPCLFSCSPLRPLLLLFLPEFCLCLLSSFFEFLLVPFIIGIRHQSRIGL